MGVCLVKTILSYSDRRHSGVYSFGQNSSKVFESTLLSVGDFECLAFALNKGLMQRNP